jgi:pimeloyl-ACP methyl ester carboxylesterase
MPFTTRTGRRILFSSPPSALERRRARTGVPIFLALREPFNKGCARSLARLCRCKDEMIPVSNSYWLSEILPNAVLLTYPDSGHGSLFQFHESFTRQAAAFFASNS